MNVSMSTGLNTIYSGVFNQDSYIFAGSYIDKSGYVFQEVYKLVEVANTTRKCTNYEVHGTSCELGCSLGTSCANHTCSCGAAMGIFEYLPGATYAGPCGPGNGCSLFSVQTTVTDDDAARGQVVQYCFDKDTPIYMHKHYIEEAPMASLRAGEDLGAGMLRKLAPMHQAITEVQIVFNSWAPMQANPKAFVEPNNCMC